MKFCCSCKQLSSGRDLSGEPLFCPHCGLSFGVRRCTSCKKKPSSPRDATYCVHCGKDTLTGATAYLDFGWLARLLTLSGLVLFARWLWPHLGSIAPWLASIFHLQAPGIENLLVRLVDRATSGLIFLGVIYFFLSLIPGEAGKQARQLVTNALQAVLRLTAGAAGYGLKLGYKLLLRLVEGDKNKNRT